MPARLFLLVYFLSGAAGLIYEVLWLRLLTLSMGNTAGAVGVLLASFMGGLALGAWAAGTGAARLSPRKALHVYATLEAAIGIAALLLPVVLASLTPLLTWAYADGSGGRAFDVTRAALALLLLSVPATAMGATYPLAVRWFGASFDDEGDADAAVAARRRAGALYAANTAGAAFGAAAAGFVLLPMLGAQATTTAGVTLNVISAAGALFLAARQPSPLPSVTREQQRPGGSATHPAVDGATRVRRPPRLRLAAVTLALSGFVALIYQVTWTRILAMVLGPTTYAFGAMLVAVIAGLAIGSAVAAALAPRTSARAAVWLGRVLIVAAFAALVACFAVDRLPLMMAALVTRADVTFTSVLVTQIAIVVAIQLPMTIALGAAFPLGIALATPEVRAVPKHVSVIYAANTAGAIAGALGGSFLLIPALGIQSSVRLVAAIAAVAGIAVVWRGAGRLPGVALAGAAAVVLAIVMPPWNHNRLANGGYRYAAPLAEGDLETGLEAGRLLYYREGAAGTVSVRQVPGVRSLAIDGKVDASNGADMLTQKLLAHLPLLLHPNPRRVCVIGLGSGVTLGAALTHPIERADVVEISREVVEASAFFDAENDRALDDPRTRLIVGDGRTHLRLARDRYDVIISEPSNPWMAGIAALFTREFFEAARARLTPGGLITQWAHTYSISDADLRSIVATFLSVFPEGTAWLVGDSDLLLIGGPTPIAALRHGLDRAWARPGVAADLSRVAVRDPFSLLTMHVAGGAGLQQYASGALVQSDDRLALEYSAPRAIYGRFQEVNVERLRALAEDTRQPPAVADAVARATAAEWTNRGLMHLQADAGERAYADFREAVLRAPGDAAALHGFARAAARSGRLQDAEQLLDGLPPSGSVPALVELSVVRAALGRSDEATDTARQAVLADPGSRIALVQLASMYAERGDEEGLDLLTQLAEQAGERAASLDSSMRLAYLRQEFERTVTLGEALAGLEPDNVNVRTLLGSAYAALGRYDRAREALEAALLLAPTDPGVLVNLGTIALRTDDPDTAADRFSEAVFLAPTLPAALDGLADALERQGRHARAATIRQRVMR